MGKDDKRRAAAAFGFAVAGLVALGGVREGHADDVRDQARELVAAGLAAQERGELAAAIEKYQQAYELIPHPELLFNLGQAHRLKGEAAAAVSFYRRYLAAAPNGRAANEATKWVAQLEGRGGSEKARASREDRKGETETNARARLPGGETGSMVPKAPPSATSRKAGPPPSMTTTRTTHPSSEGRGLRWAGISVASAGLLGLGTGTVLYWRTRTLSDELSQSGAAYDPGKVDDGKTASRWSQRALITGGVMVVGGASLYFWGRSAARAHDDDRKRLAWTPTITADGAALTVSGRFQ